MIFLYGQLQLISQNELEMEEKGVEEWEPEAPPSNSEAVQIIQKLKLYLQCNEGSECENFLSQLDKLDDFILSQIIFKKKQSKISDFFLLCNGQMKAELFYLINAHLLVMLKALLTCMIFQCLPYSVCEICL